MFSSKTCAARRREILARSRSRRRLRKITVDANTARSMRRLCNGGKHSERDGRLTGSRCVCGRGMMVHNRDDDKFDRGNPQNDVMIRLNTVEEVKPPRFLRDGHRITNRVHVLDKVLAILKNGP